HSQGPTMITNSSFLGNDAVGGSGNTADNGMILDGGGYGGAIYQDTFGSNAPLSVSASTFTNNHAVGGAGNAGGTLTGDGIGGGIIVLYYGQATAADVATV